MRQIAQIIKGMPATDGAGVELMRVIGQPVLNMLDPFLLLDAFRSDNPDDYIAGFPAHPHRGFETVTYLIAGRMRHKDNAGHEGVIEAGGIQWMTAAKGIVHSEMPEQENGLLEGFQLWVNLPAAHKMDAPAYQEVSAEHIPVEQRDNGIVVKVIAGQTATGVQGAVSQPLTQPLYLDVSVPAGQTFTESIPAGHNAFVYGIEGEFFVGGNHAQPLKRDDLAVLTPGDDVSLSAAGSDSRFLLIAGKPIGEAVARGGPFVMNTEAEIQQAFSDYRNGRF